MLKSIIKGYEHRFGKAIIYAFFTILSLVVSFILFKFLESSSAVELVGADYIKSATLGGSFSAFLITLIVLIKEYNKADEASFNHLRGNVFDDNDHPIKGATVMIVGLNQKTDTNEMGYFSILVYLPGDLEIRAYFDGAEARKTIKSNERNNIIELKLEKKNNIYSG